MTLFTHMFQESRLPSTKNVIVPTSTSVDTSQLNCLLLASTTVHKVVLATMVVQVVWKIKEQAKKKMKGDE